MRTSKLIALVVLSAVMVVLVACGGVTATPTAPSAAPAGADARNLLITALKGQLAQKAWRITATADDAGIALTNKIEFITPDRFRAVGPDGSEMIVIKGVGTYEKEPGKQWQKSATDMSSMIGMLLDPQQAEGLVAENIKYLGDEKLNGKTMQTYQYQATNKAGDWPVLLTTKIWIGAADKLPYREETTGESGTIKGGKLKQTIVYEYDPNIKITPPIP